MSMEETLCYNNDYMTRRTHPAHTLLRLSCYEILNRRESGEIGDDRLAEHEAQGRNHHVSQSRSRTSSDCTLDCQDLLQPL